MVKEEQYYWEHLFLKATHLKEQKVPFTVKNSEQKVLFSSK